MGIAAKFFVSKSGIEKVSLFLFSEMMWEREGSAHLDGSIQRWWQAWLEGQETPHLPLVWPKRSSFAKSVYEAMIAIPLGETLTYAELAAKAGSSRAARAVGTLCRKNPFPLIVPCHRVLSSSGLGGYSGGLDLKKALLTHEQNAIMQKRVKGKRHGGEGKV